MANALFRHSVIRNQFWVTPVWSSISAGLAGKRRRNSSDTQKAPLLVRIRRDWSARHSCRKNLLLNFPLLQLSNIQIQVLLVTLLCPVTKSVHPKFRNRLIFGHILQLNNRLVITQENCLFTIQKIIFLCTTRLLALANTTLKAVNFL